MLKIIFAKTVLNDPSELVGLSNSSFTIKRIKTFGQTVNSKTLFAALIESENGKISWTNGEYEDFDIIKLHEAQLRKSTTPPEMTSTFRGKKYSRSLRRYKQNERKCILSEKTWTRFFKPKHLLQAVENYGVNHG